jgi:pilus assembly protein CpaB
MSGYFVQNKGFKTAARIRMVLMVLTFVIATLVAVSSVVMYANKFAKQAEKPVIIERETAPEMVRVLVPIDKIETGATLDASMFQLKEYPKVGISSRVVRNFSEIRGQFAKSTIAPDMPLLVDYVSKYKPINQITASIPEGYRAVTINLDLKSSVEGWARAGAKVDVLWTYKIRNKQTVTTIVQNATVLSAARRAAGEPPPKDGAPVANTSTLLVTSLDANKIQLAQTRGTLSLLLRGDRDIAPNGTGRTITTDDLWGGSNTRGRRALEGVIRVREKEGGFTEYGLTPTGELVALVPG